MKLNVCSIWIYRITVRNSDGVMATKALSTHCAAGMRWQASWSSGRHSRTPAKESLASREVANDQLYSTPVALYVGCIVCGGRHHIYFDARRSRRSVRLREEITS